MNHKIVSCSVSIVKQKEDKQSRFDYSKTSVNFISGIIGVEGKMKDCR